MANSNVVRLAAVEATVNQSAVDLLEDVLQAVRAGEIVAVGIACVTSDGASRCAHSAAPNAITLLGSIARLERKVHADVESAQ